MLHSPKAAAARRTDGRRRSQGAARFLGRDPSLEQRRASPCSSARTTWTRPNAATASSTSTSATSSARGTVAEVIAQSGLFTFIVEGEGARALAAKLHSEPGVEFVAFFGAALHVSGRDRAALERALAPYHERARPEHPGSRAQSGRRLHPAPGTERRRRDVSSAIFASRASRAILVKEFIQMRRDRLTFAMIVGIPIDAASAVRICHQQRSQASADRRFDLRSRDLFRFHRRGAGELRLFRHRSRRRTRRKKPGACWPKAMSSFVVEIPANFSRDIVRGAQPNLLVEADATDPASSSNAIGALDANRARTRCATI